MSRDYDVEQLPLDAANDYDEAGSMKWVTTYRCLHPFDDQDLSDADHSLNGDDSALFWRDDCVFENEADAIDRLYDFIGPLIYKWLEDRSANA